MSRAVMTKCQPLSEAQQNAWRELIEERCGIYFPESRSHLLRNCLIEGMNRAGVTNLDQYYQLIAAGTNRSDWQDLLERLTNRETDFFRHAASFDCLGRHILPGLAIQRLSRGQSPVRIWSAGCSTGEEPYSIAMTVAECSDAVSVPVEIQASDISETALALAREGRYSTRALRWVPETYRRRYFVSPGTRNGEEYVTVNERLREMVDFRTSTWRLRRRTRSFVPM